MLKQFTCIALAAAMLFGMSGCGMSNTGKGALIGAGGGGAVGAGIGALIGQGKGAAIGAAVGAVAGGVAGTLIGKKMDKQKAELEALENAKVEEITDQNGLAALKVTFDNGILFATGKSTLSASAKSELTKFATSLQNNEMTNVSIFGHTDNTGSRATNDRLSLERANAVKTYLVNSGVAANRMEAQGVAYDYPVASNDTEEGRAQNRRVEVYIQANEDMVKAANDGTLK